MNETPPDFVSRLRLFQPTTKPVQWRENLDYIEPETPPKPSLDRAMARPMDPQPVASDQKLRGCQHAWVTPEGVWHEVVRWGHETYAHDMWDMGWQEMKQAGYCKISEGMWQWCDHITQAQLDVIYDWHVANEEDFHPEHYTIK
jgi:hypothetical protein